MRSGAEMRIWVTGLRGLPNVMGGVESHCEELLPRILRLDHNLSIRLAARIPYVGQGVRTFKGVEIFPLPSPRNQSLEAIVSTFFSVLRARLDRCQVMHIHAVGPALLAPLARLLGMKVVMTHHGADYDRAKWNGVAKSILRLGEWAGITFSNQVIAVSPSLARGLQGKFPHAKTRISYIPNGAPALGDASATDVEILGQFGLAPQGYVLTVGRLVPEKGFDYLIDAFERGGSDQVLAVVGGADHQSEFSKALLLRASGKVKLLGQQSRATLRVLYENTGVFVLPSFHEGLPISALEAASCSAPMLLSDIDANLDLGLPAHHYFPVGDRAALASALTRPFSDFAIDAQAIRDRFDWDKIAAATRSIYYEAAGAEAPVESPAVSGR